jgi:aspartate carbamoyltransferase catalytic subunit
MKVDIIVVRHANAGAAHFLSKNVAARIINAGDGAHEHPTQAILDAYSMREKFGKDIKGLRVAIVGDILHSRVALSNIICLNKLGAEVLLCAPTTLLPRYIAHLGAKICHNIDDALAWCDVAMVLRIQLERQNIQYFPSLREYSLQFGINQRRLDKLHKPIVIMHPGPINRGVELSSDVADGDNAIIMEQVENGVATRMAALYLIAAQIQR